jgi:hypothetical protein
VSQALKSRVGQSWTLDRGRLVGRGGIRRRTERRAAEGGCAGPAGGFSQSWKSHLRGPSRKSRPGCGRNAHDPTGRSRRGLPPPQLRDTKLKESRTRAAICFANNGGQLNGSSVGCAPGGRRFEPRVGLPGTGLPPTSVPSAVAFGRPPSLPPALPPSLPLSPFTATQPPVALHYSPRSGPVVNHVHLQVAHSSRAIPRPHRSSTPPSRAPEDHVGPGVARAATRRHLQPSHPRTLGPPCPVIFRDPELLRTEHVGEE